MMDRRAAIKVITAAGTLACVHPQAAVGQAADQTEQDRTKGVSIYTNQCGYLPGSEKIASVVVDPTEHDAASARVFRLVDAHAGTLVYEGRLSAARMDSASGDWIAMADFFAVQAAGLYRLQVGKTESDPIPVGRAVYANALRLAMRSYYGQRCGCRVDLGDGYQHASCHAQGGYHPSSGRSGRLKNTGGWHDAGDYGRYVVNSGIATATLLWTWEMFPGVTSGLHLAIPESGGKMPDFLAEIQWNLRWMASLQDPVDGGVWHKQTSTAFCGFVMPENDPLVSEVVGTGAAPFKSTCATADLAAVLAIAARCYAPYDDKYAAECLAAARKAYAWAQAHPDVAFKNPAGVTTGEYGSSHCSDELLWAAAELFRTTGEAEFERTFAKGVPARLNLEAPSWGSVLPLAVWTFWMSGQSKNADLVRRIVEATGEAAGKRIGQAQMNGYGNTLELKGYNWGSNSGAANDALLLLVADRMQRNPEAREAALANLHYLLGRNCFGVSWVTQVGVRPFLHPHHRPSQADGIAAPWPGLLSGGPNAHGGDAVANAMKNRFPMRMWVDDWHAFSMNEVAINWNAPLVFLLAAANSLGGKT